MIETRKMPRKTVLWITTLIVLAVLYFIINMISKQTQVETALEHLNINYKGLKVFTSASVKHDESGINGYQFTVRFTNTDTNEFCKGFIIVLNDGRHITDLACEKED
ncbi:hypothetical protein [Arcobacter sp. FWKO B]|uniref:hypothetical protein n=1 Tax=Arcobacter sp. FWKO B TaxID=2593672 RepID=UPI0018A4CC9E|nr:hypothetical protein [Arcobacter sp. FWKO B]QOG11854.1 hypothetical protein FWKOB_03690 [Arcobacter sp. FWKO B]